MHLCITRLLVFCLTPVWSVFFVITQDTPLHAQQQGHAQFSKWQVEDGLPQNSVRHIAQTQDGYLWLATEGGLARFDGTKFRIFDLGNEPNLESNRILTLYEDRQGRLLIGTSKGGLAVYHHHTFHNISRKLGIAEGNILKIEQDRNGNIWILLNEPARVLVMDGMTYEPLKAYDTLRNKSFTFINKDHNGEIILATDKAAYRWKEGLVPCGCFHEHNAWPDSILHAEYTVKDSSYWLVDDAWLYRYREKLPVQKYRIPKGDNQCKFHIRFFRMGEDKLIFSFRDSRQLIVFDIGTLGFSFLSLETGSEIGMVNHGIMDRERNTWFGTSTNGLIKSRTINFEYIDTLPDMKIRNIYPVVRDSEGRYLLGPIGNGLQVIHDGKWINYSTKLGFNTPVSVSSIVEWSPGNYYVSHLNSIYVYKTYGIKEKKTLQQPYRGHIINGIYKTINDEFLVGSRNGILEILDDALVRPADYPAMEGITINFFFEDSRQNLWFFSNDAAFRYHRPTQVLDSFGVEQGLKGRFFRGAHEDAQGRIYVGSYGFGLFVYDQGRFHTVSQKNGLLENIVSTISEDKKDNIWLTGNKGLSKIKKQEVVEFLQDTSVNLNVIMFDRSDGLINAEFNGGIQQSKYQEAEEVFLFPTLEGAVKIDFSQMENNELPPPVHIESIALGGAVYLPAEGLRMPYIKDRIEFAYTALSLVSPKNVRFKYKLEGYDQDWIEAGTERKTSYTNLSPGTYTFHVLACNNDGVWNTEGARATFRIIPPFHMTWWFYTGMVVFLSLLLSGISISLYKRTKRKQLEKSILMDVLPDLILTINRQGKYIDVFGNPEGLIRPFDEIKGRTLWQILPQAFADEVFACITEVLSGSEMKIIQYPLTTLSSGEERIYEGRFVALNQNEVLYIIRDITVAKRAEEKIIASEKKLSQALEKEKQLKVELRKQQLQEMKAIVDTEERERRRMAKDLHDSVGQLLSSVRMNLSILDQVTGEQPEKSHTIIASTDKYLTRITSEIRSISYNMMPPSLELFGIGSAIEEEVRKLAENKKLNIHFDKYIVNERFSKEIEIALYRTFQEILNNIIKHAHATEVVIQLIQHQDYLQLMIEDNGKGFDVERSYQNKNSSGLKNLRSRVLLINGKITIDSTLNNGTTINITVPFT